VTSILTTATLTLTLLVGVVPTSTAAPLADPKDPVKKADGAPPATTAPPAATVANAEQEDDPDTDVNRAQPDFTIVGLPTTLRLPRHKSAFRITHRFGRPLGEGSLGNLAEDLFGFDSGATIGFEYRYGLFKATQIAVHRTNNRTIQFLLQRQVKGQDDTFPVSIDVFGSAEGTNNFKDSYSPGVGMIVSREFTDRATVYAQPFWVNNTNPLPSELVDDNNSLLVGLGARVRLTASVYGVFEVTPRVNGYDPGDHQMSVGLEKRAGGHSFQINVSNAFGTTFGQMARGGNDDWYIGFNLSRKFY
jgi:Membrane bound beta barrel domain (DUF5777)